MIARHYDQQRKGQQIDEERSRPRGPADALGAPSAT